MAGRNDIGPPPTEGTGTGRVIRYEPLGQMVPMPPPKPTPYLFLSSRSVCSLYEVGGFKLGDEEETTLTDETVAEFIATINEMKHVAAFTAATGNGQKHAANLLTRAGFKEIAKWPGNACRTVTYWLLVRRTKPERKETR